MARLSDGDGPLNIIIVLWAHGASTAVWVSTAALTRYLESMCECVQCTLAHRYHGECKMFCVYVCVLGGRGSVSDDVIWMCDL